MGRTFRIGRILGVDVRASWTWGVAFVLAAWTIAAAAATLLPWLGVAERYAFAALAALALVVSAALHEIVYARVASAYGSPLRGATLYFFGAVHAADPEVASPDGEIVASIAMPFVSACAGGTFLLASAILAGDVPTSMVDLERHGAGVVLVAWIGAVNVAIGALHVLPAYPLDGGRLARALAWRRTGDAARATRWTAWAAQILGWFAVAAGVSIALAVATHREPLVLSSAVGAALFGWFLASASAAGYARAAEDRELGGRSVASLMRAPGAEPGATVPADVTVASAVRDWLGTDDAGVVAVVDGERVVGVVSMRELDIVPPDAWRSTRVREVAVTDASLFLAPNESATRALERLLEAGVASMPVVDRGRLVGVLDRRDVERRLARHEPALAHDRALA